jgi:hypothetical protein
VLDDLDDLGGNEETKSKKSGGAAATQQSIQDKKKALFGLPSSATPDVDQKSKKSGQSQKTTGYQENDYYARDAGEDLDDVIAPHQYHRNP